MGETGPQKLMVRSDIEKGGIPHPFLEEDLPQVEIGENSPSVSVGENFTEEGFSNNAFSGLGNFRVGGKAETPADFKENAPRGVGTEVEKDEKFEKLPIELREHLERVKNERIAKLEEYAKAGDWEAFRTVGIMTREYFHNLTIPSGHEELFDEYLSGINKKILAKKREFGHRNGKSRKVPVKVKNEDIDVKELPSDMEVRNVFKAIFKEQASLGDLKESDAHLLERANVDLGIIDKLEKLFIRHMKSGDFGYLKSDDLKVAIAKFCSRKDNLRKVETTVSPTLKAVIVSLVSRIAGNFIEANDFSSEDLKNAGTMKIPTMKSPKIGGEKISKKDRIDRVKTEADSLTADDMNLVPHHMEGFSDEKITSPEQKKRNLRQLKRMGENIAELEEEIVAWKKGLSSSTVDPRMMAVVLAQLRKERKAFMAENGFTDDDLNFSEKKDSKKSDDISASPENIFGAKGTRNKTEAPTPTREKVQSEFKRARIELDAIRKEYALIESQNKKHHLEILRYFGIKDKKGLQENRNITDYRKLYHEKLETCRQMFFSVLGKDNLSPEDIEIKIKFFLVDEKIRLGNERALARAEQSKIKIPEDFEESAEKDKEVFDSEESSPDKNMENDADLEGMDPETDSKWLDIAKNIKNGSSNEDIRARIEEAVKIVGSFIREICKDNIETYGKIKNVRIPEIIKDSYVDFPEDSKIVLKEFLKPFPAKESDTFILWTKELKRIAAKNKNQRNI